MCNQKEQVRIAIERAEANYDPTDDIVVRLRSGFPDDARAVLVMPMLLIEAAQEIEQLRGRLQRIADIAASRQRTGTEMRADLRLITQIAQCQ
jgi:RNase P protein component